MTSNGRVFESGTIIKAGYPYPYPYPYPYSRALP